MKFTTQQQSYIHGEQFSNALKIPYTELLAEQNRLELLQQLCKGKRVLHIGCADHLPLIKSKIEQRKWLHALLCEVAGECTGIDINEAAITYIKQELNFTDVYCADITTALPEAISNKQWDVVVMGEILEHVDNPVDFLKALKTQLQLRAKQLVITVPNSFNLLVKNDISCNTEDINSDHMYHFTPYTLGRVIFKSGFELQELHFADRIALPIRMKIANRIKKILGIRTRFTGKYFATLVAVTNF
jgi:SAM-dependent methyltransferase